MIEIQLDKVAYFLFRDYAKAAHITNAKGYLVILRHGLHSLLKIIGVLAIFLGYTLISAKQCNRWSDPGFVFL